MTNICSTVPMDLICGTFRSQVAIAEHIELLRCDAAVVYAVEYRLGNEHVREVTHDRLPTFGCALARARFRASARSIAESALPHESVVKRALRGCAANFWIASLIAQTGYFS